MSEIHIYLMFLKAKQRHICGKNNIKFKKVQKRAFLEHVLTVKLTLQFMLKYYFENCHRLDYPLCSLQGF